METIVVYDQAALDEVGTTVVAAWLRAVSRRRPEVTLLAAVGTTPLGIYAGLGALRRAGELDTTRLRVVQLDEYLGVGPTDRRSLLGWLRRAVCEPLGVEEDRVISLPGDAPDPAAACRAYDEAVAAAGGIDVAVLGLGPNGHLGFNEPPSPPDAPTRVVPLAAASIESNARYWGRLEDVPRAALTAGMTTVLAARRSLVMVAGESKREILRRLLVEPPTPDLPGSLLRAVAGATLLADRAAWPAEIPQPAGQPA